MLRSQTEDGETEGVRELQQILPPRPKTRETRETTLDMREETDQLTKEGNQRKEECRVELPHSLGCQLDQRYGQRYSLQVKTGVRHFYSINILKCFLCTADRTVLKSYKRKPPIFSYL